MRQDGFFADGMGNGVLSADWRALSCGRLKQKADIIFDPADNFDSRCAGALSTGPIYGLRQEKTGSEQP